MYTIIHNTRCSKSNAAIQILENASVNYTVRNYMEQPLNADELDELLNKLDIAPIEIVRTTEELWQTNYANKQYNKEEIIAILVEHPSLLQRPIIQKGNRAIIGRPTEALIDFVEGNNR